MSDQIKSTWLGRNRLIFMVGIPALLLLAGAFFYLTGGRYVSSDDAYIQAARASISTKISGTVTSVAVKDNQIVHKGDPLFQLDGNALKIAVEAAAAKLSVARLQISAMKSNYQQKLAELKSAQDALSYREQEYDRQKKLAGNGISSQAQLDQAANVLKTAQQQVEARQQEANTVLANLGGAANIDVDQHPTVKEAQANLDRANLNLSYTNVTAPMDGVVTGVDKLQIGDSVTAAAPLFALVSNNDIWIEANFKETQLTYMRTGQKATVTIDAYPDRKLVGTVASTSPGTGSSFALLPPENATGNWVKVVQRLPVRIALNDIADLPLHIGLSVTAEVDTGHQNHLFGN